MRYIVQCVIAIAIVGIIIFFLFFVLDQRLLPPGFDRDRWEPFPSKSRERRHATPGRAIGPAD